MGRGIEVAPHRIAGLGNDFPFQRNDGADRHLTRFGRNGGKVERPAHRRWQRKGHAAA
jgi:hypothetical protein